MLIHAPLHNSIHISSNISAQDSIFENQVVEHMHTVANRTQQWTQASWMRPPYNLLLAPLRLLFLLKLKSKFEMASNDKKGRDRLRGKAAKRRSISLEEQPQSRDPYRRNATSKTVEKTVGEACARTQGEERERRAMGEGGLHTSARVSFCAAQAPGLWKSARRPSTSPFPQR